MVCSYARLILRVLTECSLVTHFTMWAMVKSPLILGNDVTDMVRQTLVIARETYKLTLALQSDETKTILMNDAIIAVSQDPSGGPASQIWKKPIDGGELQLWTGSLSRRSARYLAFYTGQ